MATNTLLIGVSGPSSSGKTTVSRLLRDALNTSDRIHALILHEDDFYKTDAEIPVNGEGLQDWDCLGAIDMPLLHKTLAHVRQLGRLPPDFASKEDTNAVGAVDVDAARVEACGRRVAALCNGHGNGGGGSGGGGEATVAIVDGFLLYAESLVNIRSLFDLRLLLRTSHETARRRREARAGYVTLEGFWEDPPGYVDKVVWPNYVRDHAFLFEGGDVEADFDAPKCERLGILGMPRDAEGDMTRCFEWAFGHILEAVQKQIGTAQEGD